MPLESRTVHESSYEKKNIFCTSIEPDGRECGGKMFEIVLYVDTWVLLCDECGEEYEVAYAVNDVMAKEQV